tara:strand:+ start:64 stop:735 length:672 start_codon:yes stop_codon:yes gene_type:complete
MVREYVKESATQRRQNMKEQLLFGRIYVYVKDPLPADFDLGYVIDEVEATIPERLAHEVESIFIGQFDELASRHLHAIYKDGTIFLTNQQFGEQKMVEDIIHELAHSMEESRAIEIYADGSVEKEFLGKRKRLLDILVASGYAVDTAALLNPDYSEAFDSFLYQTIGYPKLTALTMGLFISPYAITSLREYFASGIEEYFGGDIGAIKKISPQLTLKITELTG